MKVFNDIKTRGCNDILIAVTDGLKGMPEVLTAVFPATTLQTCIVHLIMNSLDFASWKDRKALAAAIKPIYIVTSAAPSSEAALAEPVVKFEFINMPDSTGFGHYCESGHPSSTPNHVSR